MSRRPGTGLGIDQDRRAFSRSENLHLGAFLDDGGSDIVWWSRSYRCDCGFRCTAPGDIYDHSLACDSGSAGPGEQLPFGFANVDALTQSFCACGRVTSQCDGSRRGCRTGGAS